MFKRTIEVKITRPPKPPSNPLDEKNEEAQLRRWEHYAEFAEDLVWDAARLLAGYLVLDTFRKAIIAKASRCACGCQ